MFVGSKVTGDFDGARLGKAVVGSGVIGFWLGLELGGGLTGETDGVVVGIDVGLACDTTMKKVSI